MNELPKKPTDLLARAYSLADQTESKALYRDWADTYDQTMLDGLSYATPRKTAKLLAEYLEDRNSAILDIGAGTGLAGAELIKLGYSTIDALDYSADMLEEARKTDAYRACIEADLHQRLPVESNTYQAQICTGTFTHAHVGAGCLDELLRILVPGGLMACTIHKDIWHSSGFELKLQQLTASNRIEVLTKHEGTFYDTSDEPEGWYLVWRKSG